jgi:hypothetical protein
MTYLAYLLATLDDWTRDVMERVLNLENQDMKRGQAPKNEPRRLIRIAVLGFKQPCGCHCYEWNAVRQCCDQCVREGRIVPPKQIKPNQ